MTSSAQLQREADAARIGLADTLGQLRDGVAPSALSGEAIALVKDSGLSILKSLERLRPRQSGAGAADRRRPHHVAHPHHGQRRDGRGDVDLEERGRHRRRCARAAAASGVAGAASSAASSVAGAARPASVAG